MKTASPIPFSVVLFISAFWLINMFRKSTVPEHKNTNLPRHNISRVSAVCTDNVKEEKALKQFPASSDNEFIE